jgi:ubiquitin conjugation factor E4 B
MPVSAFESSDHLCPVQVDRATVSSDSFMTNLQVILLHFFEPVMDFNFSKIDRVDADYFRKSTRLSIAEETKIRATKEEADAYFAQAPTNSTPVNFISDVFFLTCAFQHVGLGKTVNNRNDLEKRLGELEKEVQRIEADTTWRNVSITHRPLRWVSK